MCLWKKWRKKFRIIPGGNDPAKVTARASVAGFRKYEDLGEICCGFQPMWLAIASSPTSGAWQVEPRQI